MVENSASSCFFKRFSKFLNYGFYSATFFLISIGVFGFFVQNGLTEIRFSIFSDFNNNSKDFFSGINSDVYVRLFANKSSGGLEAAIKKKHDLKTSVVGDGVKYSIDAINYFSKFGGREGVKCGSYKDFNQLINMALEGYGCCADHVSIFRVLTSGSGLMVREMHHRQHTFAEFFNPIEKRWIFIDPMLKVVAVKNESLMGLEEMAKEIFAGHSLDMKSFGDGYDPKRRSFYVDKFYFDKRNFEFLAFTKNANVFRQHQNRIHDGVVRRIISQMHEYLISEDFGYVVYVEGGYKWLSYVAIKYIFWFSLFLWPVLFMVWLFSFFGMRLRHLCYPEKIL